MNHTNQDSSHLISYEMGLAGENSNSYIAS